MGGFFGVASKHDDNQSVLELFYGVDYHSHLGTRRAGMAVYGKDGFNRAIHNIENTPFRTKFASDAEEMDGYVALISHKNKTAFLEASAGTYHNISFGNSITHGYSITSSLI